MAVSKKPRLRVVQEGDTEYTGIFHDPIRNAEGAIAAHLKVLDAVREGRTKDPSTFPTIQADTSPEAWAERIVGVLMRNGWTPPEWGAKQWIG